MKGILINAAVISSLAMFSALGGGYIGYKAAPKEVVQTDIRVTIAEAIRKLRVEPIALPISASVTRTNFNGLNCSYTLDVFDWPKKACGKGVWLEGSGFVTARFDLSHVQRENVHLTENGYVINIGKPEIGWTVLPAEMVRDKRPPYQGSRIDSEEMSEWSRLARIDMENSLRKSACSAHILEQASTEVKKQLPKFLALAGGVHILFETESATC